MSKIISIAFVVAGICAGMLFNKGLDMCFDKIRDLYYKFFLLFKHQRLFVPEELIEYNGEIKQDLYLAFMGTVFNVSKGSKHYGKGAPYNYFVGKDGTRAFATGNFNDESDTKDHILDLSCDDLLGLLKWKNAIREKYTLEGYLMGRYYDMYARDTPYHLRCKDKVGRCLIQKQKKREEAKKFPPCNIAWSAEEGTRVWCTKSSGGINREWVGVPRQMYSPGSDKPKCVCVNDTTHTPSGKFKEYDNCSNTSTSCKVEQN